MSGIATPVATQLAKMILAIPPARRGAVMQTVASFEASSTLEESFAVGSLRAAFASLWEERFQCPVPIDGARSVLEPPVPIATVLVFSKLMLMRDLNEMESALIELVEYFRQVVDQGRKATQLELFSGAPMEEPSPQTAPGTTVNSLSELVKSGTRFPTVYADPPWAYDNEASRAAAINHYSTMSVEEICAEPIGELATDDAHLHLWTTNGFLQEAFEVIRSWGFQFKSCLVWVKPEMGMGNYWRVSHEFLLLGVRGNLPFFDRTLSSWVQASRTAHSRKPAAVRALIERASPPPYLELYGREELPNSAWTVYGNQVERRLF